MRNPVYIHVVSKDEITIAIPRIPNRPIPVAAFDRVLSARDILQIPDTFVVR